MESKVSFQSLMDYDSAWPFSKFSIFTVVYLHLHYQHDQSNLQIKANTSFGATVKCNIQTPRDGMEGIW